MTVFLSPNTSNALKKGQCGDNHHLISSVAYLFQQISKHFPRDFKESHQVCLTNNIWNANFVVMLYSNTVRNRFFVKSADLQTLIKKH